MNQRGEYGSRPRDLCVRDGWPGGFIGAAPIQPDSDRAVEQLDAEMEAIIDATYRSMGVDPKTIRQPSTPDEGWLQRVRAAKAKASQSPLWPFWETTVSPKYDDWKATRTAFRTTPMTSWDDYTRWFGRVNQLRADVKAKGIKLETPDLVDLSKGKETPSDPSDRSKLLKWGAIGALGVGGVVALIALASSTKTERAPYERYRYGYRLAR